MKKLVVIFAVLMGNFLGVSVIAQRNCGTPIYQEFLQKKFPNCRINQHQIENFTQSKRKNPFILSRRIIRIPVVVHIVYHRQQENISDEQIFSQISVLNDDYRRFNKDAAQTPDRFRKVAVDTGIEFVLANIDPQGNPTKGITRTYSTQSQFAAFDNKMKSSSSGGIDAWPTDQYLNIWVCPLGMGVLGFGQFPGGPIETDGVVIDYRHFGTHGTVSPPFHLGRTTTHEVGHYLNLKHIWGDGPCGFDDLVDDTPAAAGPSQGCPGETISCNTYNMPQNFMDYTDDACMNLFTRGQAYRMRALFSPGGSREALLSSPGFSEDQPLQVQLTPPEVYEAKQVYTHSAVIQWDSVHDANAYELRYRQLDVVDWKKKQFNSQFVRLIDLPSCTDFVYQVASVYQKHISEYSPIKSFQTTGCNSSIPSKIFVSQILSTQATINWNGVEKASTYILQYRKAGHKEIYTIQVDGRNTATLTNLSPGTIYQYRIRANLVRERSRYSKVRSFSTSGSTSLAKEDLENLLIKKTIDNEDLQLDLPYSHSKNVDISLTDRYGIEILPSVDIQQIRENSFRLNTKGLIDGLYQLHVKDQEGFEYSKSFYLNPE